MSVQPSAPGYGSLLSPDEFGQWTERRPGGSGGSAARLVALYLRSRLAGWALLTLAMLAPASWAGTAWLISRPEFGVSDGALLPLLAFATLAAACVISSCAGSPFGDAERPAAHPLPPLRLGHLAGLTLMAALLLAAVLLAFELGGAWPAHPLTVLLRNIAGFTGLALLSARVMGARLSWLPPLAFVAGAYLTARRPDDAFAPWAWHMQPGDDALSSTVALALLGAGLAAVCLFGAREQAGEPE